MGVFERLTSSWWPVREPILVLDEVVAVLGRDSAGACHRPRSRPETVPVAAVVGTISRAQDFDRAYRPLNAAARERRDRLSGFLGCGAAFSPVTLVQVGGAYFVEDGHHRVSIARRSGQLGVDAHVRRICTVAPLTTAGPASSDCCH